MITFEIRPEWKPRGKTEPVVQGVVFNNGQCALSDQRPGAAIQTYPTFQAALGQHPVDRVFWEHGSAYYRREQTRLIAALPHVIISPEREHNIYRDDPEDEVLELRDPTNEDRVFHVCIKDHTGWVEDQETGEVDQALDRSSAQVVDAIIALFAPGAEGDG